MKISLFFTLEVRDKLCKALGFAGESPIKLDPSQAPEDMPPIIARGTSMDYDIGQNPMVFGEGDNKVAFREQFQGDRESGCFEHISDVSLNCQTSRARRSSEQDPFDSLMAEVKSLSNRDSYANLADDFIDEMAKMK